MYSNVVLWPKIPKKTLAPKALGPQDPTQKLDHRVELLGRLLSQENVFENLRPEPPPTPLKKFAFYSQIH